MMVFAPVIVYAPEPFAKPSPVFSAMIELLATRAPWMAELIPVVLALTTVLSRTSGDTEENMYIPMALLWMKEFFSTAVPFSTIPYTVQFATELFSRYKLAMPYPAVFCPSMPCAKLLRRRAGGLIRDSWPAPWVGSPK